ncbi:unnamed protein product [Paramecium sonneborni]|uniref:Transmembrane protein n=1 Tax=Paramecium sonneborni TaxID=65129 RepID=A0A8S1RPE4_9CILI|nr:unnamed protein product [Paramecium sonneborni]
MNLEIKGGGSDKDYKLQLFIQLQSKLNDKIQENIFNDLVKYKTQEELMKFKFMISFLQILQIMYNKDGLSIKVSHFEQTKNQLDQLIIKLKQNGKQQQLQLQYYMIKVKHLSQIILLNLIYLHEKKQELKEFFLNMLMLIQLLITLIAFKNSRYYIKLEETNK